MGHGASEASDGSDGGEDAIDEEALSEADPHRFTTIAHAGRDILGPLSSESVDAMIARLPSPSDAMSIIDIGCGKGEILARALTHTRGTGMGIEHNPAFAADARSRLKEWMDSGSASILEFDYDDRLVPAPFCHLAICTGAIHVFSDWQIALEDLMHDFVTDGGWALVAPGYWKQPPTRAYLTAIGGEESEQHSLPVTISKAEVVGWKIVAQHESTVEEWDDYEHTYARNVRTWCDANPHDPAAPAFRERIDKWAAAYEKWGRDTMGYVLLLMRRP